MRILSTFICVLVLGVMGCSDSEGTGGSGGSAGDGGSAGVGGQGGEGGTNGEPASLLLFITSFEPPNPAGPVEGMEICRLETTDCVVTDPDGYATVKGFADEEVAFTMKKEGFGSYIYTYTMRASGPPLPLGNATESRFEEMFELVMSPYPMEAGAGALWVSGSPEGAVLNLVGATGKPFYAADDGKQTWSTDFTAATPQGGGGFVEVAPGEYQVEVSGTSENCVPARGWPGASANTVRMPVREGYLSSARMDCK